jgi:hypothetical protein
VTRYLGARIHPDSETWGDWYLIQAGGFSVGACVWVRHRSIEFALETAEIDPADFGEYFGFRQASEREWAELCALQEEGL